MKHYLFAKNFKDFSADELMEKCCMYGIDGPNALIRNGYWINESNLKEAMPVFVKTAEKYGIEKKDLIFDTLAMTVSADPNAARETLKALREIRERLGCHTSLGVSNVSFGLPQRDPINSTFFALARLELLIINTVVNHRPYEQVKESSTRLYASKANDINYRARRALGNRYAKEHQRAYYA